MNISLLRLIITSSLQRKVSKFTKIHHRTGTNIVNTRCCSSHTRSVKPDLQDFADEFDINTDLYGNVDLEAITDNDPEKINAFRIFVSRFHLRHARGATFPQNVTNEQWRELLRLPSVSQQIGYLKFLSKRESMKAAQKLIKQEKQKKYQEFLQEIKKTPKPVFSTNSAPEYGLSKTSIFQRLRDSQIEKFYDYKLLDPMMYGPDIVFDCQYTSFMTRKEINSAAHQVCHAWNLNRCNIKPFNVVFTNLEKNRELYGRIKLTNRRLDDDPAYPFNYTSKSYLDLYPRDQLIYLSPHAIETMEVYEPDKVYIIGVMVDLVMPEPLSLAKAKKYGIRAVKFPLNKYINWKTGGKALNMDHCLSIMLDVKNGIDWKTALLKHIPLRKLELEQSHVPEIRDFRLDARAIRRMYLKNKVHEIIVDENQNNQLP